MDTFVLFAFRIGLLVLLWFFVFMALRALRNDAKLAATVGPSGVGSAPPIGESSGGGGKSGTARILMVIEGPLAGTYVEVENVQDIVLGRSPDCSFPINDDYASARHAHMFRRGSEWFVEDLDSRNGTFVNGYRIDQPERVDIGIEVVIGRTTVRLEP
ncbi:FHA domain-containing protein FhaB/FipA [Corynebacterium freiburgense]|uniref:FHA domain-containing protein FhaB/FipA n=1 Tax=Corynebacterium freiburgense TaxID=556548 RepID=UPI0004113CC2|nr:FHA domain-containing protein [Corynebacterium freiburgense]WJZ01340.1 FHA domain-containing protein FhaB [Corynebacterium freiburgense]